MDSGLLAAYRNLITEDTTSSPPPANHIKVLADKAPSTREHLGPIKANHDEEEVTSDSERAHVASNYWSRIWEERPPPPPHVVRGFLEHYTKKVKPDLCKDVSLEEITYSIKHSGNTSPGPDGIPFAAWRAAPDLAAPVLLGSLTP